MNDVVKAPQVVENNGKTRDQLMLELQQEAQKRADDCGKEVEAVLAKYRCNLVAIPEVVPATAGTFALSATVRIIPEN